MKLLNRRLQNKKNKGYTELVFLGDSHAGAPTFEQEKFENMIQYCKEKKVYVVGMGDYIEAGLKTSVGDSVYKQKFDVQAQLDYITSIFTPLAEQGLLIGLLSGNHEARIEKDAGINVTKTISNILNVPYLEDNIYTILKVGGINYRCYFTHGSTMSRLPHTKMKKIMDLGNFVRADLFAMGHSHELATFTTPVKEFNLRNKTIDTKKKYFILTGGYLGYEGSYASTKGYPPTKIGSPKVKLFSNKFDIHISF